MVWPHDMRTREKVTAASTRTPRTGVHRSLDRTGPPLVKSRPAPISRVYPGGIIVSLTMQPDTGVQCAAPSRRSALHDTGPVPAHSDEAVVVPTVHLIVAGWYTDPMGSPQLRWWDGNAWTAELRVAAPVAPLSRRRLRELVGPLTTGDVEIATSDETGPAPMSAQLVAPVPVTVSAPLFTVEPAVPTRVAGGLGFTLPPDPFAIASAALPGELQATPKVFMPRSATLSVLAVPPIRVVSARSTTVAICVFTLLPFIHLAIVWFVLIWLDLGSDQMVRYSVLVAPLFLYFVLAVADSRLLRSRGLAPSANAVLALIPPLYLLVRAIRVGAAGVVPLLLWLLLQTAAYSFLLLQFPAVVSIVAHAPASGSAPIAVVSGPITDAQHAAELTPTGMAAELTRQTRAKNLTFSTISCPPIPVTLDGTAVTCVGILASVKMNLNVLIDSRLPNSAFVLVSEAPTA